MLTPTFPWTRMILQKQFLIVDNRFKYSVYVGIQIQKTVNSSYIKLVLNNTQQTL